MTVDTLGEAWRLGWRIRVRCLLVGRKPKTRDRKSIRCDTTTELDMKTLVLDERRRAHHAVRRSCSPASLADPLRHKALLMFGVRDFVLDDRALNRALLIRRPYATDDFSAAALDACDAPGALRNFFLRHHNTSRGAKTEPNFRSQILSR